MLLVAENATSLFRRSGRSTTASAFAGVGKFSEFDQLRKIGVRYADTQAATRTAAKMCAGKRPRQRLFPGNRRRLHPGDEAPRGGSDRGRGGGRQRFPDHKENNALYRVTFDGFISDHRGFCVIGGNVEDVESLHFGTSYQRGDARLGDAIRLAQRALARGTNGGSSISAENLDGVRQSSAWTGIWKFRRLSADDVGSMLDAAYGRKRFQECPPAPDRMNPAGLTFASNCSRGRVRGSPHGSQTSPERASMGNWCRKRIYGIETEYGIIFTPEGQQDPSC